MPLIERLLLRPSLFSVHEPRLNPHFDPIRGDPRHGARVERYGGAALGD